jgi:hypothetical protein
LLTPDEFAEKYGWNNDPSLAEGPFSEVGRPQHPR